MGYCYFFDLAVLVKPYLAWPQVSSFSCQLRGLRDSHRGREEEKRRSVYPVASQLVLGQHPAGGNVGLGIGSFSDGELTCIVIIRPNEMNRQIKAVDLYYIQ